MIFVISGFCYPIQHHCTHFSFDENSKVNQPTRQILLNLEFSVLIISQSSNSYTDFLTFEVPAGKNLVESTWIFFIESTSILYRFGSAKHVESTWIFGGFRSKIDEISTSVKYIDIRWNFGRKLLNISIYGGFKVEIELSTRFPP